MYLAPKVALRTNMLKCELISGVLNLDAELSNSPAGLSYGMLIDNVRCCGHSVFKFGNA